MSKENVMILGKNNEYSLDTYKTKRNNNVLIVGTSGAGKTRGIVSPNIMAATGSYIISDPKGNLYNKYRNYLAKKGYVVKKLDFTNPQDSAHYNPIQYIRNPKDITKIAHMIASKEKTVRDPFWDASSEMLLASLIAYTLEQLEPDERNFRTVEKLCYAGRRLYDSCSSSTLLDSIFSQAGREYPDSLAARLYNDIQVAPDRTFNSILISLTCKLREFTSPEILNLMSYDDIDIASIGQRKTAIFVTISDTDRSLDILSDLFFTQAINELCRYADNECKENRLPIPVRFILDDFATNCRIDEFPRMIASIRSRGISTMLMVQAESQLTSLYGEDGKTIISNCDTYVYMGGSDVETAKNIAIKLDMPIKKILYMSIGKSIIFRRGESPIVISNIDLAEYEKEEGFIQNPVKKAIVKNTLSLTERLRGERKVAQEEKESDGGIYNSHRRTVRRIPTITFN